MKRLWISAVLLALLFVGTLFNTAQVTHITEGFSQNLRQAEEAVAQGDWDTAQTLTLETMEAWSRVEGYFSVVLCHGDTDEVSTAFQEVLGFLQYQSSPEYDSANGTLIAKMDHLAEIEALNWKNLL